MRTPRPRHDQAGFTLVEVMAAVLVLVVGVLGTLVLVDAANRQTSRTLGEEAATALAREATEVARQVAFPRLADPAQAQQALRTAMQGDGGTGPWIERRRGIDYTVEVEGSQCLTTTSAGLEHCPPPAGGDGSGDGAIAEEIGIGLLSGLAGVNLGGNVPALLCGLLLQDLTTNPLGVDGVLGLDLEACQGSDIRSSLDGGTPSVVRLTVRVSWSDGGRPRDTRYVAAVVDQGSLLPGQVG